MNEAETELAAAKVRITDLEALLASYREELERSERDVVAKGAMIMELTRRMRDK